MATMAEQSFHVFQHHQHLDHDGFVRYPEPPRSAFASPPLGMSMAPDSVFVGGGAGGRRSYGRPVGYPTSTGGATSAMSFEPCLYGDAASYVLNGRSSPDEGNMRLPSSGLSSAPSAPSSAMGSPQSNHGQLGAAHEWNAHGLSVQPGIVGNDYMEYFSGAGMEDLSGFVDFGSNKTFVGMYSLPPSVSMASELSANSSDWVPSQIISTLASNPAPIPDTVNLVSASISFLFFFPSRRWPGALSRPPSSLRGSPASPFALAVVTLRDRYPWAPLLSCASSLRVGSCRVGRCTVALRLIEPMALHSFCSCPVPAVVFHPHPRHLFLTPDACSQYNDLHHDPD